MKVLKGSDSRITDESPGGWSCRQLPFLAVATLWVAAIYAVSRTWAVEQLVFFGIGMLLLGVPMCLAGICSGTLRRKRVLSAMFQGETWLFKLWLGRWLRILAWAAWGLGVSAALLLQLNFYDHVEWGLLVLIVPLFTVVFTVLHRGFLKAKIHEDFAVTQALAWSRWLCAALIVLLYMAAMAWLGDFPRYETVGDAIAARAEVSKEWAGNALIGEMLRWLAYFHGVEDFALGRLRAMEMASVWWLFVTGVGNFALFYSACLAVSCFCIPLAAFEKSGLRPKSPTGWFMVALSTTFLPMFIFLPILAQLDGLASKFANTREGTEETTRRMFEAVEQIWGDANCDGGAAGSGCYYKQGTVEELKMARTEAAGLEQGLADQLRREVDVAFRRLENEAVDEYLDWYYSLAGEYGRLWILLTGGTVRLEEKLSEKSNEIFGQEKWFTGVNAAIERLSAADQRARTEYKRVVRGILERNRVDAQQDDVEVVSTAALDDIIEPLFYEDFVSVEQRFGVAGVGGSAAAAVVARIVATKMLAKTLIKAAAKLSVKTLAGQVGAGAGAALGAVGGGVFGGVPGVLVGILVGILGGIGGGVLIDGALLKLEESLSRDEFRHDIVAAIHEARQEFEDKYLGYAR